MIGRLRIALAAGLVLAAGNAWALGLGQIQVKSKRNQPLLAEIPIVSTTPGELQALQARLASPETFRRVGLAPPSGVASDLQFSLGSDPRGRPVIRVTTVRPVDQAVLNFLIEVDWGQGRLVREYSALIDVPQAASAALPAAIELPATPAPAVVQRPLAAAPQPAPRAPDEAAPEPDAEPAPAPPPAPAPVAAAPAEPVPTHRTAIAAATPSAAPVAASAVRNEYGPVKHGESLSAIASQLDIRRATSLEQTMLALLRANPDAFLDDDINRLRRGAVLRVPSHADVAAIDADQARQVVRRQMQQWRQARRAVRQPQATAAPVAAAATAGTPGNAPAVAAAAAAPAARPAPVAATPRRSEARLEIVPAAAPGKANGTRSGTAAGGEGNMQQQIRQRDEDIAAKAAEIEELKERVAALEKLKDEQQSLISLKDSELAAAQQRLADARTAPPPATTQQAAPPPATTQQAAPPPAETRQESAAPVWWIALGVMAAALLAWLLAGGRRRKAAAPGARRLFDSDTLAASMAPPLAERSEDTEGAATPVVATAVQADPDTPGEPESAASASDAAPAWHAATRVEPAAQANGASRSTPEASSAPMAAALAGVAAPSASQRFKLVRAFLDIGDDASARQLLQELQGHDDAGVRSEATRMLEALG